MKEHFSSFRNAAEIISDSRDMGSVLTSLAAFVRECSDFDFAAAGFFRHGSCSVFFPPEKFRGKIIEESANILSALSMSEVKPFVRRAKEFCPERSSYDKTLSDVGAKCELIIPKFQEGAPVGFISLVTCSELDLKDAQTERAAELFGSCFELIFSFVQNKEALKELWWEFNDYQVFHNVSKSVFSALDREKIFRSTAAALKGVIGYDRISISLLSEDGSFLKVSHLETSDTPKVSRGTVLPVSGSYVGKVITSGEPLLIDDLEELKEKLYSPAIVKENLKSYICLPLTTGDKMLGVISLASRKKGCYSKSDIEYLERITPQIAHSFHHSMLYDESNKRYKQMKIIADVSRFAAETSDFNALAERVVKTLRDDYYTDSEITVFTADENRHVFELSAYAVIHGKKTLDPDYVQDVRSGILGKVYRDGKTYLSNNTSADKYYVLGGGFESVSEICVPLVAEGKVLGLIDVGTMEQDFFHNEDVDFLETLAAHLSQLLYKRILFDCIQTERDVFSKIVGASQFITSTLDYRKTFEAIAHHALDIIGGESCRIYVLDNAGKILQPVVAYKAEHEVEIKATPCKIGEGLIGHIAGEGGIELINNAQNDPRAIQIPGTPRDKQHFMIASLKYQNNVIGAMAVIRQAEKPFADEELDVFKVFSGIASNVLANSKLHDDIEAKKSFLETLIESSPDAITANDSEGYFTFFSKGAEEIFGYSQDEIIGKPVYDYYEGGRNTAREVIDILKRDGKIKNYGTNIICRNKEIIPVDLSAALLKSPDGDLLGAVAVSKDMRQRVALQNKLMELSIRDELTGLFNYRHFHNVIVSEISRADRQRRFLSLILFDLDGFKEYNDNYGHLKGDEALKEIGGILRRSIRDDVDSAFRYGGDEFTILLPDADADVGQRISKRLGDKISSVFNNRITISSGVVEYDFICSPEEFIRRADTAMYKAKTLGGNRAVRSMELET